MATPVRRAGQDRQEAQAGVSFTHDGKAGGGVGVGKGFHDVSDNRASPTPEVSMTVANELSPPQGFAQLTEGLIRTTDLVLEKTSSSWCEPHCFAVGRRVGVEGTRVARRIGPAPKARGRS